MRYFLLLGVLSLTTLLYAETLYKEGNTTLAANSQKKPEESGKLKLMFQVFIYTSDLENAYKVAKKAIAKHPKSLYWHQKMAEICQWLDKREEAIKHYNYIYSVTQEEELGEKILDYSIQAYQFESGIPIVLKKLEKDRSKENIEQMIFLYDQVGSPEDAVAILEKLYVKDSKPYYLKRALDLTMFMGDLQTSDRLVKELKQYASDDLDIAEALSHYYIMNKDMKSAYDVIKSVDVSMDDDIIEHYQKVSDIGWSLQDIKSAAEASKKLHQLDEARLQDYERIFYYYNKRDPQLLQEASLRAYQKYKKDYILMNYINILNTNKEYARLAETFKNMKNDPNMIAFKKTTPYWLMKGQMHGQLKQFDLALHSFKQAMRLDPKSISTKVTLMWAIIDSKDKKTLQDMIFELEEKGNINPQFWLPLAVGNFQMQRSDKALFYVKKMMKQKNVTVETKFMYAYIMQVRNDEDSFMGTMRDIFMELNQKRKAKPSLMREKAFLKNYLSAGMYVLPVDEFDALLYQSRKHLSKTQFTELALYWAMLNDAQERASFLAQSLNNVEPWLKLNRAMHYDDRNKQLDILYSYMAQLPIRDRVSAAVATGNISLAQTMAFDGMEKNRYDALLYQQNLNLVEQYVDTVSIKTGYQSRSGLQRAYIKGDNRYYLMDGWRLLADFQVNQDKNTNTFMKDNVPKRSGEFHLGMQKNFSNGYFKFKAGYNSALEDYCDASAKLNYKISKNVMTEVGLAKSKKAEESLFLLHGGKKDNITAQLDWQYVTSSLLSIYMEYDKFYSQDDAYLGDGYSGRVNWRKQIRNGYPDMSWGFSYLYGKYDEKKGSKGVIDELRPNNSYSVLSDDFQNVCANFSYGMVNKEQYTRVWRAFGEFSPCYNMTAKQGNLFFSGGMGGSVYDKDHLSVGVTYDQAAGGTQETNLEIYLRYKMFY